MSSEYNHSETFIHTTEMRLAKVSKWWPFRSQCIGICKKLAKPQKKRKKSEKVCTFWFCTGTGRILHGWLACPQSVTYSLKQLLSPFLMAEQGRGHPPWWSDGILVTFTHLYHCRIWLGIQKKAEAQQKFRRCHNTNQFLATHGLFNGICEKCDAARWIQ